MSTRPAKLHRHKVTSRGTGLEHRTVDQRAADTATAAAVDAVHLLAPATAVGLPRPTTAPTTDTTAHQEDTVTTDPTTETTGHDWTTAPGLDPAELRETTTTVDPDVLAAHLAPHLPAGWSTYTAGTTVDHLTVVALTDDTGATAGYVLHSPGRRSPYAARAAGQIRDWISDPAAAVLAVVEFTTPAPEPAPAEDWSPDELRALAAEVVRRKGTTVAEDADDRRHLANVARWDFPDHRAPDAAELEAVAALVRSATLVIDGTAYPAHG